MQIIDAFPPNIDKIKEAFPTRKNTVYTYGGAIFAPGMKDKITRDLAEHERVHIAQQGQDPEGWWDKYIADPDFRLSQELEAYRIQYRYYKSAVGGNKPKCFNFHKYLASDLSSPMYGNIIGMFDAMRAIEN